MVRMLIMGSRVVPEGEETPVSSVLRYAEVYLEDSLILSALSAAPHEITPVSSVLRYA